jgi:hypothetical protein
MFGSNGGMFALLALLGGFLFLFVIIGIVLYILAAFGLYKLAQKAGVEYPWLAWIPIGNMYILAKLVKTVRIGSFEVPSPELVLPIAAVLYLITNRIPVLGTIIFLAYLILLLIALYRLYYIYRPENATLWLVLSIILFFMGPIFIFIMRNDTPPLEV